MQLTETALRTINISISIIITDYRGTLENNTKKSLHFFLLTLKLFHMKTNKLNTIFYECHSLNEVSLALLKNWSILLKAKYSSPKTALRTMNIIVPDEIPNDWETFDVANITKITFMPYSNRRRIEAISGKNDD